MSRTGPNTSLRVECSWPRSDLTCSAGDERNEWKMMSVTPVLYALLILAALICARRTSTSMGAFTNASELQRPNQTTLKRLFPRSPLRCASAKQELKNEARKCRESPWFYRGRFRRTPGSWLTSHIWLWYTDFNCRWRCKYSALCL